MASSRPAHQRVTQTVGTPFAQQGKNIFQKMNIRSTLTRADYENYLVYLGFGRDQDLLKACINRAYRDFNRTMHGFSKFEKVGQLYDEAAILLKELLEKLRCSLPLK